MKFRINNPFGNKNMKENKDTIEEHRENEEVTPAGEPVGPNITPDIPEVTDSAGEEALLKLKADLAEMSDKFLRLYSEFDNYRKRTQKERVDLIKSASSEMIISMLPVLDDFERALKFAGDEKKDPVSVSGLELIYQKFKGILESKGLKKMNSLGEEFNVDHHDAITNIAAPSEEMKGKVIEEAECGYFLNDKVIRHAKVIVGN